MLKIVFEGMSKRLILEYLKDRNPNSKFTTNDLHQVFHTYILGDIKQIWSVPKLGLMVETTYSKAKGKIYFSAYGVESCAEFMEKDLRDKRGGK